MFAYSFDENGFFNGMVEMQPSPLEPGVRLLPAKATLTAPPRTNEKSAAQWDGEKWSVVSISSDPNLDEQDPSPQDLINFEAQNYLNSTDWYVIREMDCGVACPPEIKQKRAEARAKIIRG